MTTNQQNYERTSTVQQRRLLFDVWQETGNVAQACQTARLSRATFYYWKARFERDGYAGLEQKKSCGPHNPSRVPQKLAAQIVEVKKMYPAWGKKRIATFVRHLLHLETLSPNTVRRILADAGLW